MASLCVHVELDKEKLEELIENYKKENPDLLEIVRCKDCRHGKGKWSRKCTQRHNNRELPKSRH